MSKYEYLQTKKDECITKALNTSDCDLKVFFFNAAEGFQIKLEKLSNEVAE